MSGKKGRRGWGWLRLQGNRWSASYIGPDCQRHYAPSTFTGKMTAEAWLAAERQLIELGTWIAPAVCAAQKRAHVVTVGQYAQEWINQRDVKPRTRTGYQAILDNHIAEPLGDLPLTMLTSQVVRGWYANLDGDRPTARAHTYQLLHAVLATAVVDGLLPSNPCNIPKALQAKTIRQATILTPDQLAALADAMEPKRLRMLVLISAWCGPRWGEVIELRRTDVSADCSVITIGRGATHRQGKCWVDTPKSGKGRKVVAPPHIRADLEQHLEQHVAKDPGALLFPPTRDGCHLNDRVFRDYFTAAQKAIGVEGVTIHDLRHYCGTSTARVANLVETMARLGHSTAKASSIYQQAVDGRDAEVAAALSRLANGDTL